MVRFNDKTAITTVASGDILPITDISDSADDKKITVGQLSQYTVDNISTLTDGKGFSTNDLTDTLKLHYDSAYSNMSTLGSLNSTGNNKLAISNMYKTGTVLSNDSVGYTQLKAEYDDSASVSKTDTIGTYSITYKLTPQGSKITDIANLSTVQAIYALLGYSEYYVIDTTNQKFYLPLLDNPLTDIVLAHKNFLKLNCYRQQFITPGRVHNSFYIKGDTYLKFELNGIPRVFYNPTDVEYTISASILDTGSALQAGKQYYIYLVETATPNKFNVIVSLNATYPTGYSATTAYCIGGFHTLCVGVTSETAPALPAGSIWDAHPAIGYSAGDIIPNSFWCETHRPMCNPAGMVYVDLLDLWVDIYLQSGTGTSTTSAYGGTITNSRTPIQHQWDLQLVGKRPARDTEFMVFAEGSNQKTNISGSAQPSPFTAGGHVDTASKRMISGYFIEECCGLVWQWLDEIAPTGGSGWNSYGDEGTRGQSYGMPYILRAGGAWDDSTNCGSRSRSANNTRSIVYANTGCRGVSLPKFAR